ncbi:hypothetical protein D9M68_1006950 [compost metagenome]
MNTTVRCAGDLRSLRWLATVRPLPCARNTSITAASQASGLASSQSMASSLLLAVATTSHPENSLSPSVRVVAIRGLSSMR